MEIKNFEFTKDQRLGWSFNGKEISIDCRGVVQTLIEEKSDLVFVLYGNPEGSPELLKIYSPDGSLVEKFPSPENFHFSYLTKHPSLGVAVVAGGDEKVDNWYDWHFGYDSRAHSLYRFCPAY